MAPVNMNHGRLSPAGLFAVLLSLAKTFIGNDLEVAMKEEHTEQMGNEFLTMTVLNWPHVKIDNAVPPGEVHVRRPNGEILAKIENIYFDGKK